MSVKGFDSGASAPLKLTGGSPTSVVEIVKGSVGQTADLQQWQDSSGTVIGRFSVGSRGPTLTADCIQANNWGLQFVDAGNNELFRFTTNGKINTLAPFTSLGGATGIPLVVQGAASQTADLFQIQSSTGAVQLSVQASQPHVYINCSASSTSFPTTIGMTNFGAGNAARLQFGDPNNCLQNANGNSMQIISYHGLQLYGRANGTNPTFGVNDTAATQIYVTNPGDIGCIVNAAAAQTADLTQWQASNNAVLARVDASGNFNGKHLIGTQLDLSGAGTPTIAGAGAQGTGFSLSLAAGSTDSRGVVNMTTGTGTIAGAYWTLTFSAALPRTPIVLLSYTGPNNSSPPVASSISTTGFTMVNSLMSASTVFNIAYVVIV